MDFAALGRYDGIEKDALGCGGFTRVDMGDDADVSCAFEVSHGCWVLGVGCWLLGVGNKWWFPKPRTHNPKPSSSPAVMRKRFVCLRHAVGLVAFANGCSSVV